MREDLIERLQLKRDVWRGTEFGDDICELLDEAAAALEAAQEDAERLDSGTIRIIERDEFGMQHTTAYSGVDLRAAIDQARGKGVA